MPLHISSTSAHHQEVEIVLHSLWYHHTYRCDEIKLILKYILCIKLVKYRDKYTEMHGRQNVKKKVNHLFCTIVCSLMMDL